MIKNILLLIFAASISLSVSAASIPNMSEMSTSGDFQEITISMTGSNVHITGANGLTLYIYNITGMCVDSFKIEGADKRYELNLPKGCCYILKVGNTVCKISIPVK